MRDKQWVRVSNLQRFGMEMHLHPNSTYTEDNAWQWTKRGIHRKIDDRILNTGNIYNNNKSENPDH